MNESRSYNVTLPADLAELVEDKIKSGAYANAADVIREGLQALVERDEPFEAWLRDEAVRSYDEYMADPSIGIPIDEVKRRIRERGR